MTTEPISPVMQAGCAFAQALADKAMEACDQRDPYRVFYYMKRVREIEGTLRTIELTARLCFRMERD